MRVDVDAVANLIRDVAAREVLPRFKGLRAGESWEKRPGSVVTVADERAEAALVSGLRALLPGAAVVAEEACEADPDLIGALARPGPVWVVDPIDGTANFADGRPDFAVMVALVGDGETVAGWIYHPISGAMVVAERGAGAWRDGARLAAAAPAPAAEMTGALRGRLRRERRFSGRFRALTANKCCGVDYLALGSGRSHFAFYRGLEPWDHAPGQLIHSEAGGYSACLDGAPYSPGRRGLDGLLLTPDRETWRRLAEGIRSVLRR